MMRNKCVGGLALVLIALGHFACRNPVDAVADVFLEQQVVRGERAVWTGTLKAVTVRDEVGRPHQAVALRITEGPLNPAYVADEVGAGGEPDEMLLVERPVVAAGQQGAGDVWVVIDPKRVPIGRTVQVSGRSSTYPPRAAIGYPRVSRGGPIFPREGSGSPRPKEGRILSERVILVDDGSRGIELIGG